LKNGAVVDEFTSVVDRNVAKSACVALRRYVTRRGLKNIVLASCHYDILEWLQPDWWFDTANGVLHSGRSLRRPEIKIRIYPCKRTLWSMFRNFHYYNTGSLPSSCRPFLATAEFGGNGVEEVVGFVATRPLPSGTMKKAYIACRTVVLPDFQGLGIGPRISDAVAQMHIKEGKRYFSKTTSHRLGGWRDRENSGWRPTSKYDPKKGPMGRFNRRVRGSKSPTANNEITSFGGTRRVGYFSHEYVGIAAAKARA
jgi:GNAT superfamily N-acetyltransferase